MTTIKPPALPPPVNAWDTKDGGKAYSQWHGPAFDAEQLRAIQIEAMRAALEAAERETWWGHYPTDAERTTAKKVGERIRALRIEGETP